MARPTWQGHLKLSLVTCPVALYTGTSATGDVRFNLINPDTGNRIKMVTTDPETGPVERRDLVKGFEIDKGQYILVTEDEIRSVRLESTKTINIERFVAEADIDRLYWDAPYFLVPDGAMAAEAFAVIREAMKSEGQVALGRVVMSTRERLLALEPRGKGIIAHTLRTKDEVRSPDELFAQIPDVAVDASMVAIAKQIVKQAEGAFDPTTFVDRYEQALRAMIEDKRKGHVPTGASEPSDTQVADLMTALRASLAGAASSSPGRTTKGKRAASAPAAKPKAAAAAGRRKAS